MEGGGVIATLRAGPPLSYSRGLRLRADALNCGQSSATAISLDVRLDGVRRRGAFHAAASIEVASPRAALANGEVIIMARLWDKIPGRRQFGLQLSSWTLFILCADAHL
jgi:hypothetical protein